MYFITSNSCQNFATHRPVRSLRVALLLFGLLGLLAQPSHAQQFNPARLDSLLSSLAAHDKLTSGSLAITRGGQVVYAKAFGYQQVETKTPATSATRYRIGSATKMFTAVMIFQLIQEKKLTLTTPLARFFPLLPNVKTITVDQLLSHRSGLYNYTKDTAWVAGHTTKPRTNAQMLELIGQGKPEFAPGTKAAYNNSGFLLLGYMVEQLTGQSYAQALQRRILNKAGLLHTSYGGKINPEKQEAPSYAISPTGWQRASETDMSYAGGAGALVSTPADLNRFLTALFDGRLVSAASLKTMRTVRDGYGRGLLPRSFGARPGYGHTGGLDAFVTLSSYFPAQQLAVTLCSNGQNSAPQDAFSGALSIYLGLPYRLPTFRTSSFVPAPAELARYVGTYASAQMPGLKITMTRSGTTLQTEATGQAPVTLEPVGTGVFKFDQVGNDLRIEFDPTQPSFLLKQGGGSFLFIKEK